MLSIGLARRVMTRGDSEECHRWNILIAVALSALPSAKQVAASPVSSVHVVSLVSCSNGRDVHFQIPTCLFPLIT